jgi:putative ABC transport system permease protein
MLTNLRFALRRLLKAPGYTLVAVSTLAIGIGACTAVFSIVNAVLLRPLPYPDSDRLVFLHEKTTAFESGSVSYPNFTDWREGQHGFTDLSLFRRENLNFAVAGATNVEPQRVVAVRVAGHFLEILGLPLQLGRSFSAEEDTPGGPKATVLSDRLWRSAFNASPDALGRIVKIDGVEHMVVGVADPNVKVPRGAALFVPFGDMRAQPNVLNRGSHGGFTVLARLRPDVNLGQAIAELDGVAAGLEQKYPDTNSGRRVSGRLIFESTIGNYRHSLLFILGSVLCVLLIACANVAGLQLARAASRAREMAVRAALGATRGQVARQFFLESVLLAALGGAAGVLIAWWSLAAIQWLTPPNAPRFAETRLDWPVLAFNCSAAFLSAALVGLWPAWRAANLTNLSSRLHAGGTRGGSEGPASGRAQSFLVVGQVALALILLTGAGLLIRSFQRAQRVPLGFEPGGVLMVGLELPKARYESDEKIVGFFRQLTERVRALPGVNAAAVGRNVPFDDMEDDFYFHVTGTPVPEAGKEPLAEVSYISADYFRLMGISLLRGRTFTEADSLTSPAAVIIDESMADKYFPGADPVGRQIDNNQSDAKDAPPVTIVGVVRRTRNDAPGEGIEPMALPQTYFPQDQFPERGVTLLVRTSTGDPQNLTQAITREIHAIDPEQAVNAAVRMDEKIAISLAPRLLTMSLLGVFSGVALLLALVGLYGLLALSVNQRTREFGIRMALGATAGAVRSLVLRRGLLLVGMGAVAGIFGAVLLSRVMGGLLFNTGPFDLPTFASVIALLAIAALIACLLPARRATHVDPAIALRAD